MQKVRRRIPSKELDTNAAFQWRAALECVCDTISRNWIKITVLASLMRVLPMKRCQLPVFNAQLSYALFVAETLFSHDRRDTRDNIAPKLLPDLEIWQLGSIFESNIF